MKVFNTLKVYEVNGCELKAGQDKTISVESHWNRNAMVVLTVEGVSVTVLESELSSALENATNVARY